MLTLEQATDHALNLTRIQMHFILHCTLYKTACVKHEYVTEVVISSNSGLISLSLMHHLGDTVTSNI